jgi:hypothetical protein
VKLWLRHDVGEGVAPRDDAFFVYGRIAPDRGYWRLLLPWPIKRNVQVPHGPWREDYRRPAFCWPAFWMDRRRGRSPRYGCYLHPVEYL